jgi:uncharacterized phage protein (TIGR01671 family)
VNGNYLFRGKDDNGKWLIGQGVAIEKEKMASLYIHRGSYSTEAKVIPQTVGQYIGIKDSKGSFIFEGDILRNMESGEIGAVNLALYETVKKDEGYPCWCITAFAIRCRINEDKGIPEYIAYLYEVIGNIFDNPELLDDKKRKYYCDKCKSEIRSDYVTCVCPTCGYNARKLQVLPEYETVEQWERRTGRKYQDDGLVWVKDSEDDPEGWRVDTYRNAVDDERCFIVIADPPVPPPDGWIPKEEPKELSLFQDGAEVK